VTDAKFHDEMRTKADWYIGSGIYGNGIYMVATSPAGSAGPYRDAAWALKESRMYARLGGAVTRLALAPDARVADYDALRRERDRDQAKIDRMAATGTMSSTDHAEWTKILKDEGRYAALRNYDAIAVPHRSYVILLNRNKVAMQRDNI
jgi:hypothetical protein